MALTLYIDSFSISPYAFSVYVALEEKGVPYVWKTVSLPDKAHHRAEYRDASITGRVPAIDHDGFWLAESAAIVDYLDEVFAAPQYRRALPEDIKERARARMVLDWIRSDLMAIREERADAHDVLRARRKAADGGRAGGGARGSSTPRRASSPTGATSLFGAWSQADSDLAFMLQRLVLNGHDVPSKLRGFVDAQWARPSVQKWVAHERPPYVPY